MLLLHLIFLSIYIIIVVVCMVDLLMEIRQPVKTMAWLLVLTFAPFLGMVLYFFFGQNTRKKRLISQRSIDQLDKHSMLGFVEQRHLHIPEAYRTLIQLFTNQSLALPFKDNEVDIYTSGYDFFPALLADISAAQHHIHLDVYIFEDDALGRLVADALIHKALQGVEVRLIYDDVGCWQVPSSFFEHLREAGIDVHAFMPVKFPAFTSKVN